MKEFPNGFLSWQETHYQVVVAIEQALQLSYTTASKRLKGQGIGGLYELAEELTDKFEEQNEGNNWSEDYWLDGLGNFLVKELDIVK